ncbi:Centrin-2 [Eumeta japonica]|uniref:Centrin-2 n=1 Tax=Eumeta variegata TaxID=151549 RepID=A0A4C1VBV1_EUMVA|nr:Centrin-2 [Eumeta japonica]
MDANIDLSATAEVSELEQLPGNSTKAKELHAKLHLTKEQRNNLRQAFNYLDRTGEGKIRNEDFRVAIKALGYQPTKEELMNMINAVDKGRTGKMSFKNFETALMRKMMSQDSDTDIMKTFRMFDMDDCGYITLDNLKTVNEILGTDLTEEEIEELIDDADKDFDGQPPKVFTNFSTSLGMIVRMRTALTKVPCGSLDAVASTCDAPGTMSRRPRASRRTVWEALR